MKFRIDKNIVEFIPEGPQETADLEVVWRKLIDCVKETRHLVPVGEYVPQKNNAAMFHIEGGAGNDLKQTERVNAEERTYICAVCNKYKNVAAGEKVPVCCNQEMETV